MKYWTIKSKRSKKAIDLRHDTDIELFRSKKIAQKEVDECNGWSPTKYEVVPVWIFDQNDVDKLGLKEVAAKEEDISLDRFSSLL